MGIGALAKAKRLALQSDRSQLGEMVFQGIWGCDREQVLPLPSCTEGSPFFGAKFGSTSPTLRRI